MEKDIKFLKSNFLKHESNFKDFWIWSLKALKDTLLKHLDEYKEAT